MILEAAGLCGLGVGRVGPRGPFVAAAVSRGCIARSSSSCPATALMNSASWSGSIGRVYVLADTSTATCGIR